MATNPGLGTNNKSIYKRRLRVRCSVFKIRSGIIITYQEAKKLLARKRCDICSQPKQNWGKKGLVIDHDHRTGRIRGVLCPRCNFLLGILETSDCRWFKKAERYRRV